MLIPVIETENYTYGQRGEYMQNIKHYSVRQLAVYCCPYRTDDKQRAGVVAEGKQAFRLRFRESAAFVKLNTRYGSERKSAYNSENKRRRTGGCDIKKRPHNFLTDTSQYGPESRIYKQ